MKLLSSYVRRAVEARVPSTCTIELLAPCNLKCPHCYVTHSKKNQLTLPVLTDLFEQLAAAGTFFVTLTGGEIGLRKDLFEIIARARAHKLGVKLLSSGTRWGPKEWDQIAELGVCYVRMSLYAMDPAVHDAVTLVPGSHAKTMATAAGLEARGVQVAFSCPVLSTNAHEAPRVVQYCRENGFELAVDSHIMMTDRHTDEPKLLVAARAQLETLFADPRMQSGALSDDPCQMGPDDRACGVGRMSFFLKCTGDVHPCGTWPRSGGNILEQRILDIFRNSPEFNFARGVTYADMTGCHGCGDAHACHPCVAMNLEERGSVAEPSAIVCDTAAAVAAVRRGDVAPARRQVLPIVA